MPTPNRFLFDNDFLAPSLPEEVEEPTEPMITVAEHETLLAQAREEGRREGVHEGQKSAEAETGRKMLAVSERIATTAQSLIERIDHDMASHRAEAAKLALTIARKLAPALIEREPLVEITALLDACMGELRTAPHLAIRVAEDQAASLDGKMKEIARQKGFEGRLVVMGEPDMATGDCRVEWADGGIERRLADSLTDIEQRIALYFKAADGENNDDAGKETTL